jgi:hypothetical protein
MRHRTQEARKDIPEQVGVDFNCRESSPPSPSLLLEEIETVNWHWSCLELDFRKRPPPPPSNIEVLTARVID